MNDNPSTKTLLLIGGSGFIGEALGIKFTHLGWRVRLVTRRLRPHQFAFPCEQLEWDGKTLPTSALAGVTAVINLAGQGIADKSWTLSYRQKIRDSRVHSTRALAQALAGAPDKPKVICQASAVGLYGLEDNHEPCTEDTPAGDDFLASVCRNWESEAAPMADHTRLVIPRIGLVLGWGGGALQKLWDIYATGVGSILGTGSQWLNWIHIDDIVQFFVQAVDDDRYSGPFNLVAPGNLDNTSFHQLLAAHTRSFSFLHAPRFAVKAMMGERADLMLKGRQVLPARLQTIGFEFKFTNADKALNDLVAERARPDIHYLRARQWLPVSLEEIWRFVSAAENLERITPSWLGFKISEKSTDEIEEGTTIEYGLKLHGVPVTWRSRITAWQPQSEFVDEQEKGPYSIWHHRHTFQELAGGTLIEDRVDYKLPLFPLGQVALPMVKKDIDQIFEYRKQAMAEELIGLET